MASRYVNEFLRLWQLCSLVPNSFRSWFVRLARFEKAFQVQAGWHGFSSGRTGRYVRCMGLKIRWRDELSGSPGKSQKEGQEEQGTLKQLVGFPLALLSLPGPPGLPSGSSLGSLTIHQATLS